MKVTHHILAALAAVSGLSSASTASAAVTISITQAGNDVALAASGTFDRSLATFTMPSSKFTQQINGGYSFIGFGAQQKVDIFKFSGPKTFGSLQTFFDTAANAGTAIGFNTDVTGFFIAQDYVSNAAISTSALVTGKTLASLGLSAGTYEYLSGQNTISLVIGQTAAAAVPEPATWAMMVLGFGVVGGLLRRPRRLGARTA